MRPLPAAAPKRLGRYELLGELASGGMATVYLGRARGIGGFERLVAVKCCHAHLREDADFVSMFLDEARLAAKIHHPNVVPTLDVGDAEELYLVMEYCEGDRLATLVNRAASRDGFMPVDVVLRIMVDVLQGLHAAHELTDTSGRPLQIVHRDVTPQNILVGVDGVSRLVDFGVAKAEARANTTKDGALKGKIAYMAPEQIGEHEVSRQSDVFSAGVVLWEALASKRLFRSEPWRDSSAGSRCTTPAITKLRSRSCAPRTRCFALRTRTSTSRERSASSAGSPRPSRRSRARSPRRASAWPAIRVFARRCSPRQRSSPRSRRASGASCSEARRRKARWCVSATARSVPPMSVARSRSRRAV
jgi:serine/threonine protein kinase